MRRLTFQTWRQGSPPVVMLAHTVTLYMPPSVEKMDLEDAPSVQELAVAMWRSKAFAGVLRYVCQNVLLDARTGWGCDKAVPGP